MPVSNQQLRALLDLTVTSSAAGVNIPILYGTTMVPGNIIWSPGLTEVVTGIAVKDTNGNTHTLDMYSYTCSFAVAFCEGPGIITKIWGDTTVLYDNTGSYVNYQGIYAANTLYLIGEVVRYDSASGGERFFICVKSSAPKTTPAPSSNNPYWQLYTGGVALAGGQAFPSPALYTGDELQAADPTILAALGVENTPAYRGLVYAVWTNLDLTSFNNRIPSIRAIVQATVPVTGNTDTAQLYECANAFGGVTNYTTVVNEAQLGNAWAGQYFLVTGFTNAQNNGYFLCTASDPTHLTLANPNGVGEAIYYANAVNSDSPNGTAGVDYI